eukprot:1159965-Pelagomonas_calceolata.AAC.12
MQAARTCSMSLSNASEPCSSALYRRVRLPGCKARFWVMPLITCSSFSSLSQGILRAGVQAGDLNRVAVCLQLHAQPIRLEHAVHAPEKGLSAVKAVHFACA